MDLIALTGPQLSGKTTLARELERRGYLFIDFTGRLKHLAAEALSLHGPATTRTLIEQDKPRYRRFLQEYATLIGYDNNPRFVDTALQEWYLHEQTVPAVFDNVRTMEQWQVLKPLGFTLVRIYADYDLRFSRARSINVLMTHDEFESQHDHIIEQGGALWDEATMVLDGSRNVTDLAEQLIGGGNESTGERGV